MGLITGRSQPASTGTTGANPRAAPAVLDAISSQKPGGLAPSALDLAAGGSEPGRRGSSPRVAARQ